MKEWWINLPLREKQMVAVGIVFVSLFISYTTIWLPLSSRVSHLRDKIHHDQTLLTWMQDISQKINRIEQDSVVHAPGADSILALTQSAINSSSFAKQTSQLRQANDNSVQFTVKKVNFDKLVEWLTMLWQTNRLTVSQLTLTPDDALGSVSGEVVLQEG